MVRPPLDCQSRAAVGLESIAAPGARTSEPRNFEQRKAAARRRPEGVPADGRGMAEGTWSVGAGLEDRGVIITGAAGGIGRAIAKAFATAGARVLAIDVDQSRLDAVLAECPGKGHTSLVVDLTDLASHPAVVERAVTELGGVYALAHAAAVLRRRNDINAVTEDDWDFQLDTNLKATFFLCRAVASEMAKGQAAGSSCSRRRDGGRVGLEGRLCMRHPRVGSSR